MNAAGGVGLGAGCRVCECMRNRSRLRSDPTASALIDAMDSCGDAAARACLETELQAMYLANEDEELYKLALRSTTAEIRDLAPQIQLFSLFEGEDRREPLNEIARLVLSLYLSDRLESLTNDESGVLLGLHFRLDSTKDSEDHFTSKVSNFVLTVCLASISPRRKS